jgi:L-malate glycosyltransferase
MSELLTPGHAPRTYLTAVPTQVSCGQGKLRILHLVSSLRVGGMEQMVLRFTESQRQMGHDARAIAFHTGPLLATAREAGLPVQVVGGSHAPLRVARIALALARFRPDIIHAHNSTSLHYAVLGKQLSGAGVVMTDHNQPRTGTRTPTEREERMTDAIVAVSQSTALKVTMRGRTIPLAVIPNGVDMAETSLDRAGIRAGLGLKDGIVGIMVARLEGLKRHIDLLQALALLRDRGLPLTMLIVGDGAARPEIEQAIQELKLGPDRVRMLGMRSDVMQLLSAADFFVLPSETEGMPVSILEAMKSRLPVIATPVGGIPELVTHEEHGLLTPVKDPVTLAQNLERVVCDSALRIRLGNAAYERARAEFDFRAVMARYIELYYRVQAAN